MKTDVIDLSGLDPKLRVAAVHGFVRTWLHTIDSKTFIPCGLVDEVADLLLAGECVIFHDKP